MRALRGPAPLDLRDRCHLRPHLRQTRNQRSTTGGLFQRQDRVLCQACPRARPGRLRPTLEQQGAPTSCCCRRVRHRGRSQGGQGDQDQGQESQDNHQVQTCRARLVGCDERPACLDHVPRQPTRPWLRGHEDQRRLLQEDHPARRRAGTPWIHLHQARRQLPVSNHCRRESLFLCFCVSDSVCARV